MDIEEGGDEVHAYTCVAEEEGTLHMDALLTRFTIFMLLKVVAS